MKNISLLDWAGGFSAIALVGAMQQLDARSDHMVWARGVSAESEKRLSAVWAKRQMLSRRDLCHRIYGPQTAPVEFKDGNYGCQDARGRKVQLNSREVK